MRRELPSLGDYAPYTGYKHELQPRRKGHRIHGERLLKVIHLRRQRLRPPVPDALHLRLNSVDSLLNCVKVRLHSCCFLVSCQKSEIRNQLPVVGSRYGASIVIDRTYLCKADLPKPQDHPSTSSACLGGASCKRP